MKRTNAVIYIVIAVICLLAILPRIVFCFQGDASLIEQLLKFVVLIIGIALIWFVLFIALMLLNLAGYVVLTFLHCDVENIDKGAAERLMTISAIIVIIAQFIYSWGIKSDNIAWALYQLFPFLHQGL